MKNNVSYNKWLRCKSENKRLEYLFNVCADKLTDEEIVDLYEDYEKLRRIQTGLGMAQSLPTNSTYKGKIFEI